MGNGSITRWPDATKNACAPKGDDHAKVALEFESYGRSGAISLDGGPSFQPDGTALRAILNA